MIEKLVTSKVRVKILKLFLSHIDDRYYLRELERMLDESLSPLRRELIKLVNMGILVVEEDANLKYYRLDKNFEGLDDLRKVVLGNTAELRGLDSGIAQKNEPDPASDKPAMPNAGLEKRFRYDVMILTAASLIIFISAIYIAYSNAKNINAVANLITDKKEERVEYKNIKPVNDGEMASKRWKIFSGNVPVFSSGETGEDKNGKEL